jgi:hypothetical protein
MLVDVVADELNISTDSAYRRIRGETGLTLEELKKLCGKFGISLDALITSTSDSVIFSYRAIKPEKFDYRSWFSSVSANLKTLASYDLKEIIYGAKDIPFFYYFILPRLATFKLFFWSRNIHFFPQSGETYYDPEAISKETIDQAREVWELYLTIPSTEIWSEEAITVTLRQIEFYYQTGKFRDAGDALGVLEDYRAILSHAQKQAALGSKFRLGYPEPAETNNFKLYLNEVVILDNTVYFRMGKINMVHLAHNIMNILSTTDPMFCEDTWQTLNHLIKNSTLISSSAEKERNRFFNAMFRRIDETVQKIK